MTISVDSNGNVSLANLTSSDVVKSSIKSRYESNRQLFQNTDLDETVLIITRHYAQPEQVNDFITHWERVKAMGGF